VRLVGDLPFYVAHDSADVWRHRGLFSLGLDGRLLEQSGVPPDYFAATGQLWGTPVYRWWRHRLNGFRWWLDRLERQLELFDLLRLDHFRALEAYWSVPGGAATAEHGTWCPSPGRALLTLLWWRCWRHGQLLPEGRLPLIAEDLGVITPAVEALRDRFSLPGMKILQFAFDGNADNPYLPANYRGSRWVVYTGTHDNATTAGWWRHLDDGARGRVATLVGGQVPAPAWQLLELALASTAELAVVPLQDLLELGDEARFNTPGTIEGNWTWRLTAPVAELQGALQGFGAMAAGYGRGNGAAGGEGTVGGRSDG
jgi:4-alpha-glucanotransferase